MENTGKKKPSRKYVDKKGLTKMAKKIKSTEGQKQLGRHEKQVMYMSSRVESKELGGTR